MFIQTVAFIIKGVNYSVFYCKYMYLRICAVLCPFLLMSYNRSYGNSEDLFQASQAKDSSAVLEDFVFDFDFCFGFAFYIFTTMTCVFLYFGILPE